MMRLSLQKRKIGFLISIFILTASIIFFAYPVSNHKLTGSLSLKILSSEGTVLRKFQADDGSYSEYRNLSDYPEFLIDSVILAEDRHFYYHPGFNPFSFIRALKQNLSKRKIVSGGSTITQQLARIVYKDSIPGNRYLRKIIEIIFAFKLELHFSKDEILNSYLNRAPLKFNQTGFASAARTIFDKDVRFLSKEEIISLIVLLRHNHVSRENFKSRFFWLWGIVSKNNPENISSIEEALFNTPHTYSNRESKTMHFETWIKSIYPDLGGEVKTALSQNLNADISSILNNELRSIQRLNAENGAVIVLKNPDRKDSRLKLIAMIGSRDFNDAADGQVNGCIASREAGSTLKPFIYAIAMDKNGYRPNDIINDRDISIPVDNYETYRPRNFDLMYWGPMTLSEALAASRNIPAIYILNQIGVQEFYNYLIRIGFTHLNKSPEHYGLALGLGIGGASLLELTRAYSAIINNGILKPLYIGDDDQGRELYLGTEEKAMSEDTAAHLIHILSNKDLRRRTFVRRGFLDFPFEVAAKTGTSKDFRDAWTIGFTKNYIVGVWIGNFSGSPMWGISGGWGAGRVFHQVIRLLTQNDKPGFQYSRHFSKEKLCRKSGLLASDLCPSYFELIDSRIPIKQCRLGHRSEDTAKLFDESDVNPVVLSPVNGETYILDPLSPAKNQLIPIKISLKRDERKKYYYQIDNGRIFKFNQSIEDLVPLERGGHILKIFYDKNIYDTIMFTVK